MLHYVLHYDNKYSERLDVLRMDSKSCPSNDLLDASRQNRLAVCELPLLEIMYTEGNIIKTLFSFS